MPGPTTASRRLPILRPSGTPAKAWLLRAQSPGQCRYDPVHYGVPEGSCASTPDGPARIREHRAMVQALHKMGLRVVLDVVYNHTFAAGVAAGSSDVLHQVAGHHCLRALPQVPYVEVRDGVLEP